MSENFTAEDFAKASFARHPDLGLATRDGGINGDLWMDINGDECDDSGMALYGWTPVVESRVTEHTLRDSQEKAARKREKLVDHIADQDRVIRRRNDEITALRLELADAQAPLSLDTLAAAWEAAGQADECREGDVLIIRDDEDNYLVRRMNDRSDLDSTARILYRAPKREPWADLADVLGDFAVHDGHGREFPDVLARLLHERGVRVTGGDGDE